MTRQTIIANKGEMAQNTRYSVSPAGYPMMTHNVTSLKKDAVCSFCHRAEQLGTFELDATFKQTAETDATVFSTEWGLLSGGLTTFSSQIFRVQCPACKRNMLLVDAGLGQIVSGLANEGIFVVGGWKGNRTKMPFIELLRPLHPDTVKKLTELKLPDYLRKDTLLTGREYTSNNTNYFLRPRAKSELPTNACSIYSDEEGKQYISFTMLLDERSLEKDGETTEPALQLILGDMLELFASDVWAKEYKGQSIGDAMRQQALIEALCNSGAASIIGEAKMALIAKYK